MGLLMICVSREAVTFKSSIRCSQYNHWLGWTCWPLDAKANKHICAKRSHAAQHPVLVPLWGGNRTTWGEWERVRRWLCLQAYGSWLVGLGSRNGHWFWGLRVLGLFEKDLWSRIKVIYLRTEDHVGFWSLERGRGEIQRARGGEWGD